MNKDVYKDGIYDISNEAYHASPAISRSKLMLLDKSPYHFWHEVLSGEAEKKEATPAMKVGSLFHTLLLEPAKFDDEYLIITQKTMPTKGTNPYNLVMEEAQGRTVLTREQFDKTKAMADATRKHEIVSTLLDEAAFEQSIFWTDEETGLQFKTRPDIWAEKMIVDLKTTSDASINSFVRSAFNYGYYLQAGMAFEACKAIGKPFEMFVILACEKEAPHVPAVFMMDDEALQFGIDQFTSYKKRLKKCLETNTWPGYVVQELSVPKYAVVNEEEAA